MDIRNILPFSHPLARPSARRSPRPAQSPASPELPRALLWLPVVLLGLPLVLVGCFDDEDPAWPADFAVLENDCSNAEDWDEVYRVHLIDNSEAGFALDGFGFEPTNPLSPAREGEGKIDGDMIFHLDIGFGRGGDYDTKYCEGSVSGKSIVMSCDDGSNPDTDGPNLCIVELGEI